MSCCVLPLTTTHSVVILLGNVLVFSEFRSGKGLPAADTDVITCGS